MINNKNMAYSFLVCCPDTPVLALTASADMASRDRVIKILHMEGAKRVTVSPNRSNIRLGLTSHPKKEKLYCLDWIVDEVRSKATAMAPIIIYCRTYPSIGNVFAYLKAELKDDAWLGRDPEKKLENLLIGMFTHNAYQENKDNVISSLSGQGNCRVVVATTALGMGLNFPNISHVVMFGPPDDTESIVQMAGRAGRNGQQSHSVLITTKQSIKVDKVVKEVIKTAKDGCFRKALYSPFEENTQSLEPGHLCCTFCHTSCSCNAPGVCVEPLPCYERPKKVFAPVRSREVTDTQRTLIKDMLNKYKNDLVADKPYLFTSQTLCTGFSNELIVAVLQKCAHIFDLDFIVTHLPVVSRKHAMHILQVITDVFHDIEDMPPALPEEASFCEPDLYYRGYFDEKDEDSDCESNEDSNSSSDDES